MSQIYEGMFLLDNQVVRTDWRKAKAMVGDTLAKHGATVHTLRRWEEKRLAYPIQGVNRATYFLGHYEIPGDNIPAMLREFDLSESVLRYLIVSVDEVTDEERQLAGLEEDKDFVVPEPPADDAQDEEPEDEEGEEGEGGEGAEGEAAEKDAEGAEKAEGDAEAGDKQSTEGESTEGAAATSETAEAPKEA